jgi:uridylate kinase
MKYKRILINLSGELFPDKIESFVTIIKDGCKQGRQIAIVCGGGNVLRGGRDAAQSMNRALADQIGMLSTVINGVFLHDILNESKLLSALGVENIERYNPVIARPLIQKHPLILVGGIGQGGVSTDTVSVLRAQELGCDVWVKVTKYGAVYDSDPATNPDAQEINNPTYAYINAHNLGVVDQAAAALGKERGPGMIVINGEEIEDFWNQIDSAELIE